MIETFKKSRWVWPLGLIATSLTGAAVWPVRSDSYSYQVCMGCGIKRLFDEKAFRSYGPYSYDLQRLMVWERAQRVKTIGHKDVSQERSAS